MKVNIGPYLEHLSTNKLECAYLERMYGENWHEVKPPQYIWVDHLVIGFLDLVEEYILEPINKIRNRKVKVKYHNYDTWSLDHTLALIILPSGEDQWEWVMEEMIWAFNEIANDYPEEETFHSGVHDIVWTKVNAQGDEDPEGKYSRMDHGPNHTFNIDFEARKAYDDRIQRGLNLFGKYYRSLWD